MNFNKKTILTIIIGLILVAGSLSFANQNNNNKNLNNKENKNLQNNKEIEIGVSITEVSMIDYTPIIEGNGDVQAKIELNYESDVSGRVYYISPSFDEGLNVKKGDILIKIEDTKYKENLATANLSITEAKLNLLEEEREAEQAKNEWVLLGLKGEPLSDLVLRKPQLEKAKAMYDKALATYNTAKQDLEKTIIKSPFDAYISKKNIEIGSYIQSGTEIGTILGTENYEIKVPLSQNQWNYISNSIIENENVKIKDSLNNKYWIGKVSRIEKQLDSNTRQRSLFVEINNPLDKNLYSGIFAKVYINGEKIKNVWELPQTAINAFNKDDTNEILMIDKEMKIRKIKVFKVFENNEKVFVRPVEEDLKEGKHLIITKPLITYKNGTKVKILGKNNA